MKIKVGDLYDLSLGLNDLSDKDLDISTSLKVEKNQKNVSEELIPTDKIRQKINDKHKGKEIVKDEQVVGYEMKKGKTRADYDKEVNELMDQEVEVNLQKIKISELEGIKIKPRSIRFLNTILDKEDNAK